MTKATTIAAVFSVGLTLAPLPASAHNGENERIFRGIVGGLFGAVGQALCHGECSSYPPRPYPPRYYPPGYYPPAYYPLPGNDYAPPMPQAQIPPPPAVSPPQSVASDPDIAFVQHALNVLDGAGLAEDGVGGPATKQALLGYLQKQLGSKS